MLPVFGVIVSMTFYLMWAISHFDFEGWICVLIASVPDLRILLLLLHLNFSSKAVVLLWFSVACFWCQSFGDVSPYVCSYHFSSVWIAEWPPFDPIFEIAAHSVDSMFSLYFDYL